MRDTRSLFIFRYRPTTRLKLVDEVIDTIRLDALRGRLHLLVEKRFRGEMGKCQGCTMCK